jgi:hypothetical protein
MDDLMISQENKDLYQIDSEFMISILSALGTIVNGTGMFLSLFPV